MGVCRVVGVVRRGLVMGVVGVNGGYMYRVVGCLEVLASWIKLGQRSAAWSCSCLSVKHSSKDEACGS